MDKYEGLIQVLTLVSPPVENAVGPEDAVELAKRANDELAELVFKYPDRFVAAIACLPMNDMEAALKEVDRAINELHFRGVQIASDINGKPLDSPEFLPFLRRWLIMTCLSSFTPIEPAQYRITLTRLSQNT